MVEETKAAAETATVVIDTMQSAAATETPVQSEAERLAEIKR